MGPACVFWCVAYKLILVGFRSDVFTTTDPRLQPLSFPSLRRLLDASHRSCPDKPQVCRCQKPCQSCLHTLQSGEIGGMHQFANFAWKFNGIIASSVHCYRKRPENAKDANKMTRSVSTAVTAYWVSFESIVAYVRSIWTSRLSWVFLPVCNCCRSWIMNEIAKAKPVRLEGSHPL